jgi:heat shock protein HslJ
MKKIVFAFLIITVLIAGCRSAPVGETSADFSGVIGKEWKLTEVWLDGKNTGFDRHRTGVPGEIFTLNVTEELFSGTGAPNRYSAPYTRDNYAISVSLVRATLMAPIREPDRLKEHDFFIYLQNISAWSLSGHKLTFTSKNTDGTGVSLIFTSQ